MEANNEIEKQQEEQKTEKIQEPQEYLTEKEARTVREMFNVVLSASFASIFILGIKVILAFLLIY